MEVSKNEKETQGLIVLPGLQHDPTILERGLPKWPQMRIEGVSVTVEQAKEIIRRTDSYFNYPEWSGNDKAYCQRVMKKLGIPSTEVKNRDDWHDAYEKADQWRQAWGLIQTEYVHNSWIACAFIHGPHGWCHPTGRISYVDNVGKWPSVQNVYDDWVILAKEFPFLHLVVILMDREECEDGKKPVAGFYVRDGSVVAFDPKENVAEETLASFAAQRPEEDWEKLANRYSGRSLWDENREHGIPWSWIEEWNQRSKILDVAT